MPPADPAQGMPDSYRGLILLAHAAVLVGALLAKRRLVSRQIGRNPVLVRPWRNRDTAHGYLELVLSLASGLFLCDVLLNVFIAGFVRRHLALPVLRSSGVTAWAGVALLTVGLAVSLLAVVQMGRSWRMGIDREGPGALVTGGLYRRIRHPIYSGMLLAASGLFLMTADVLALTVAAAAWVGLPVQARLEEEFLASTYPDYESFKSRTGRFWPERRS